MTHNSTIEQSKAPVRSAIQTAQVSILASSSFVLLLGLLHLIKPEIDPSWRFISEYAIGNNGWIMMLAFLLLGMAYLALYAAVKPLVPSGRTGKIGLILLLISAAGLILAGVFVTDPITASEAEHTTAGAIHSLGGTLGMAMPFAALFLFLAIRKESKWAFAKRSILLITILAIAAFLFGFASLAAILTESEGKFGPEVLVGWPNRIEMAGYCIWLLVFASKARQLKAKAQ